MTSETNSCGFTRAFVAWATLPALVSVGFTLSPLFQGEAVTFQQAAPRSALIIGLAALGAAWWSKRRAIRIQEGLGAILHHSSGSTALTTKVAQASRSLSETTAQQAAAVQETAAALTQMSSLLKRTSEQAAIAFERANEAAQKTRESTAVMDKMLEAMGALQRANVELEDLSAIFTEISAKTRIINEIVFKTQLLSFNASIEAARAGQHGRGFAVVAEEVGSLARTSGVAAKEIHSLLERSRHQVEAVVGSTTARIHEGQSISTEALDAFGEILQETEAIAQQAQGISQAVREQDAGVLQINSAMSEIDKGTRLCLELANEVQRIGRDIAQSEEGLQKALEELETVALGGPATTCPSARVLESEPSRGALPVPPPPQPDLPVPPPQEEPALSASELLERVVAKAANISVEGKGANDALNADDPSFRGPT